MAFWSWSTTAATNQNADSSVLWPEGQAPSTLNDSARALMSSLACWRQDTSGERSTTGGATAFAYTTSSSANLSQTTSATPPTGMRLRFAFNQAPAASPTLAVDGGTAFPFKLAGVAPVAGAFSASVPYTFEFDGSNWNGCEYYPNYVPLNTLTASNSASLVDTTSLTASHSGYKIVFNNLVPTTNAAGLSLRYSNNGGVSYANTNYAATLMSVTGSAVSGASFTAAIALSNGASNNAGIGVSGELTIHTPSTSGILIMTDGRSIYQNSSSAQETATFGGYHTTFNTSINAIQFVFGAGNISSGTVHIYGIA